MKISIALLMMTQLAYAGYDGKTDGFYLKHFAKVNDNVASDCTKLNGRVYRGGVPDLKTDKWIKKLKEEGIQLVVDLRHEGIGLTKEKSILEKNNIKYILIPIDNVKYNKAPVVDLFWKTTYEVKNSNDRVYVHCQRGEDRTGVFIGTMRTCPSWKTEFKDFGGVLYPSLKELMEDIDKD